MKPLLSLLLSAGCAAADITVPNAPAPPVPPLPAAPTPVPTNVETPAVLSAASLLGTEAAGPTYRVREQVPTDGYMAYFTIDSDFGQFECVGLYQEKNRIREMAAIQKLVEVSKSDLFAEGVKRSLEQPVEAVKKIAKDPVNAVTTAPKTVGHFFKKVGKSISNTATNIQERVESGDNSGTGADISRGAKSVIGFDSAKLECAKQLGVDPYSDNERLQAEIEKVSWVFFSGGLPLRLGAAAISGGASFALTATKMVGLPEEIYALTPSELAVRNQQAMESMGVEESVATRFAANEALSITLRRSIIRSLQALGDIKGRAGIIAVAADCENRRQAEFLNQALLLLARRQMALPATFVALEVSGRLPTAVDANGVLHVPAPVDYLSWTAEVAEFARRDDLLGRKPVLMLEGGASERTRTELAALGWSLTPP